MIPTTRQLAREVALTSVTAAVAVGLRRLFSDWSFLRPVLVVALVSHLVSALTRRWRRPLPVAAVISAAAAAVTLAVVLYPGTTWLGLPTRTTWDVAGADLRDAWSVFGDVRAPTEPLPGFVLTAALACWIVAFLADWAAFRIRSAAEALAPSALLFGFSAMLARGPYRELAVTVYLLAVLAFLLVSQLARREERAPWLVGARRRGRRAILAGGLVTLAVTVVAGLVAGPALPGAEEEQGLVDWRDIGDSDPTRVTISPLVDIRSRLVELEAVEVFTVAAPRPEYWRLTSLESFDGTVWGASADFEPAAPLLDSDLPTGTVTELLPQTFDVVALDTLWAPAAYEPQRLNAASTDSLEYDPGSATLVVTRALSSSDGLRYQVDSAVPRRDVAAISAAAVPEPSGFGPYLELPSDFSPALRDLAFELTSGEASAYGKALALQEYFRTGFEYTLDVDGGHSVDRMEQFVFEVRAGYCEQFAGTYAALARSIGLPARVAVGFTPGDLDPASGLYRVRGEHAHAWPEVYLDGIGWLRFEPTPGRGAPGDEVYTGHAAEQSGGLVDVRSPDTPEEAAPAISETTLPPRPPVPLETEPEPVAGTDGAGGSSPWPGRLAIAALAVAIPAVLLAGVTWLQRWWRRRQAVTVDEQVEVAWREAWEATALLGLVPGDGETPIEFAARTRGRLGPGDEALARLATLTVRTCYAADEPGAAAAGEARELSGQVAVHARHRAPRTTRVRARFDPRDWWVSN